MEEKRLICRLESALLGSCLHYSNIDSRFGDQSRGHPRATRAVLGETGLLVSGPSQADGIFWVGSREYTHFIFSISQLEVRIGIW